MHLGSRASRYGSALTPDSGLTAEAGGDPAEPRLALLIGARSSPEEAAGQLGLRRETVRNELKAIFSETGTHRQGELVALLSKL
jgi:DNA-binding CsgD family transcriptional regulator